MPVTFLDHNHIALRLEALAPELRAENYAALACILRGGAFLAAEAAFATGLPLHFIDYARRERQARWRGAAPRAKRLLLCEDIAGSGNTLNDCTAFLAREGYTVDTLVICVDAHSASRPRWALFESADPELRFLLPWERYRLNGESVRQNAERPDHRHVRTAWDLDGVFVSDVESHHYRRDLDAALAQRDTLPLAPFAPRTEVQDCVITGRPLDDAPRTLEWCRRMGLTLAIHFRDDGVSWPTPQQVADFKSQRAIALGCTRFVESDAAQAAEMARLRPELSIVWWNEGRPLLLRAAPLADFRHAPAP